MSDHNYFANLIWQIADLLRGPYRPPQYERVMLPMTVLRRFHCVLAPSKAKVLAEYEKRKGGKLEGDALDTLHRLLQAQRTTECAGSSSDERGARSCGFSLHYAAERDRGRG